MKSRNLVIVLSLSILGLSLMSLIKAEKTYDYLYVIQHDMGVYLVKPNTDVQTTKLRFASRTDFGPALAKVQEMETQGWELVSNTVTPSGVDSYPSNYFLMRKSK